MTGTSEIQVNDLGTTELHKQHRVQLEPSDGAFLRGSVVDQIYIDKLLLSNELSMQQHATAEWFLNQAVKANVYVTTPKSGTANAGDEVSEVKWCDFDEIPELPFPYDSEIISEFRNYLNTI